MTLALASNFLEITKEKNKYTFLRGGITYDLVAWDALPRMTVPGDAVYDIYYVVARRRGEDLPIGMLYSNAANIVSLSNGLFNGPVKLYPDNSFICIHAEGIDAPIEDVVRKLIDRGTDILAAVATRMRPVSEVEKGI